MADEKLKPKMVKYIDDPCFGIEYDKLEQCDNCWVKKSCFVKYKNSKNK